jgi:hypothetical protein
LVEKALDCPSALAAKVIEVSRADPLVRRRGEIEILRGEIRLRLGMVNVSVTLVV